MIIKWDKGEILHGKTDDDPEWNKEGKVDMSWSAGSVEFEEHWLHVAGHGSESFTRYDQITHVNFYNRIEVEWLANGCTRIWSPKGREIAQELMKRLRALFIEGKGAGSLAGDIS